MGRYNVSVIDCKALRFGRECCFIVHPRHGCGRLQEGAVLIDLTQSLETRDRRLNGPEVI